MSLGAVGGPRHGAWSSARSIVQRDLLAQRRRRELRDVRHPGRPELRVERVIVCPSGVHVLTWLPPADGSEGDGLAPPGLLSASRAAADLVAALLPPRYRGRVRPVLCRLDEVAMAELVGGVLVTSPSTLEHIVASSPVVLSTSEVNDVALRLEARLQPFPLPSVPRRGRWARCRGRRTLLAGALVASSGAAAVGLAESLGGIRLPW